eukprot:2433530-Rhodomonas_salina.1
MSGTDLACTENPYPPRPQLFDMGVLRIRYAIPGTDAANVGTRTRTALAKRPAGGLLGCGQGTSIYLRACYAISGTHIAYGATRSALQGPQTARWLRYLPTRVLCDV